MVVEHARGPLLEQGFSSPLDRALELAPVNINTRTIYYLYSLKEKKNIRVMHYITHELSSLTFTA